MNASRRKLLWASAAALLTLALLALVLGRTVVAPRDRFWERIQQSGRWRVAMDPSFPPFEMLDGAGQPVGFDVDLAQAIAGRWGVQVQLEAIGYDSLVDAVWASKVDSAVSALPLQPQLSQDVSFSQPYFEAGLMLVTAADEQAIASVDDLAGRRVAVEWGSEGDVQARALRRRLPDVQILPQETAQLALQAVAEGQADATLVDNVSARQFVASDLRLRIHPQPVVSDPYVIVLPRKAPILQRQVGEALEALRGDGTLQSLSEKWLRQAP